MQETSQQIAAAVNDNRTEGFGLGAKMSVRTRIYAGFGVVAAIPVILGLFSLSQLSAVNNRAAEIRNVWLPETEVLGQIKFTSMRYRQIEAAHILQPDAAAKAKEAQTMQKLTGDVAKLFEQQRLLVLSDEERAQSDATAAEWKQYLALSQELVALSDSGDAVGATKRYTGDMRSTFNKYFGDLQKTIDGTMAAGKQAADTGVATYLSAQLWIAGLIALALLFCTSCGYLIGRGIVNPVTAMTAAMKRLAGGDTATEVPARGRGDEIGAMAKAVQVFKSNMIEADRLRVEQQEEQQRKLDRSRKIEASVAGFERAIGEVVSTVSSSANELHNSAAAMSVTAEQTAQQSTAAAAAAEQASVNVQTVSAATEQLSSSVEEIGRQVVVSSRICADAVAGTTQTRQTMQLMAESAEKITSVVTLINDIASQTRLLALNATIEAARAGDAGKGFAVVAAEVKNLASQTAGATEAITAQIAAVQSATIESVKAIEDISHTISQVNDISATIAAAVEQQGAATREIARNVHEAAQGTNEVSSNINGVSSASSETGSAATQVLGAAGELSHQAVTLRDRVEQFLTEIR